jgi:general secretion pathway protein D
VGREAALMLSALLALTACERPSPPVLAPLDAPGALQPAAPRVNSALGEDRARLPVFESRAAGKALAVPLPVSSGNGQDGDVTLTFVDTDIREIIRVILGATLKLNYTIDPSVQGTATLEVGRPLPRSALLPTLETLLNQNGSTLSYRDGIYRVMALGPGATTNIAVGPAAVGSGAQVVQLRHAAAKDLVKVLEPYVSEGGKITADQGRNALIVSGDPAVRQTLTGLISAFDIDALAGQSYALFPAGDKAPDKLAAELEKVLRIDNDGPLSGIVRIVPMSRVNAVLVVSAQPRYIDEARRFLGVERRVEEATARGWHVYYVQNGQSSDLENLLQRAFTPRNVSAGRRPARPSQAPNPCG